MTREAADVPQHQHTGLEIAMQWADLPAEHLQVALKALEPQLRREHELRMAEQSAIRQMELETLRAQTRDAAARRSHSLRVVGLVAGFLLSAAMLAGAVVVGMEGHVGLASMLSGPSVLALASLFVLRRSDNAQTRAVARAQAATAQAAAPPP
ncbi:hypothetical protein [Streptomyces agglomeratus]|uniref:hypothetical protein n=1 Tax=Streptomyces agglomeratus TaxID=285458 RepID=UPI0008543CF2|nr:hypothetical protein [Streptomyces agglomeratus]OEJ53491.1 hypothetical protein BGK72_24595 [Streptomyces agglomeratus]